MKELTKEQIDRLVQTLKPLNPMRDPATVKWFWITGIRNDLAERIGINASYREYSDAIGIPEYQARMLDDRMMVPTYCHELCHACQRERMGLALYVFNKTFHRNNLEMEALIEEKRVQFRLNVTVLNNGK